MVHNTYNGQYSALEEKGILPDTCRSTDTPRGCGVKQKKLMTRQQNSAGYPLHEPYRAARCRDRSRTAVTRGCGEETVGNLCLLGFEFKFCKMKSSGAGQL